ncbi:hypothetical protein VULLAG_LOCUS5712 [Vulpes lagopus]
MSSLGGRGRSDDRQLGGSTWTNRRRAASGRGHVGGITWAGGAPLPPAWGPRDRLWTGRPTPGAGDEEERRRVMPVY